MLLTEKYLKEKYWYIFCTNKELIFLDIMERDIIKKELSQK